MIVLDLEWNRSYDRKPLDEILQIGAVRVEEIGGPIVDTFSVFIRPTVHKRFDPGARKLPELQASVQSTVEFPAALEQFRAWCGEETAFAAWGGGDDFKALRQNCEYWNIPPVPVETVCDLQTAFSYLVGAGQQVALWRAVEYCGIPDIFDFHNALCDAMYTAVVARWITPEALAYRPERREKSRRLPSPRLSKLSFSKQPRRKVGPQPTPEGVLNARAGRQPACPICGRMGSVSRWSFVRPKGKAVPLVYYSVFRCQEHGRFLCRMTLSPREDGTWVGRRSVPAITPELAREFEAARQGGTHVCRSEGRKKRKSRPTGKPSAAADRNA
ncbi:MAG: exonuclease domain-containing protein [Oscillibacter sp.]|nr:exonuclease domain-containing protein [Oscillibacter sp.]